MTLEITNLAIARGGVPVLEGLSFALTTGQALVIRGPNGIGKTTLLRTLAGLQPPLAGEISGAGLDVFENEAAVSPELRDLPNVMLLPHMGSATMEGRMEMGEKVLINIKTFADGHRPPDQVLPSML